MREVWWLRHYDATTGELAVTSYGGSLQELYERVKALRASLGVTAMPYWAVKQACRVWFVLQGGKNESASKVSSQ